MVRGQLPVALQLFDLPERGRGPVDHGHRYAAPATTPHCDNSPTGSSGSSTDASKPAPSTTRRPPGPRTSTKLLLDIQAPGMSFRRARSAAHNIGPERLGGAPPCTTNGRKPIRHTATERLGVSRPTTRQAWQPASSPRSDTDLRGPDAVLPEDRVPEPFRTTPGESRRSVAGLRSRAA